MLQNLFTQCGATILSVSIPIIEHKKKINFPAKQPIVPRSSVERHRDVFSKDILSMDIFSTSNKVDTFSTNK